MFRCFGEEVQIGTADKVALGVVDAEFFDRFEGGTVFDKFGDGLDADGVGERNGTFDKRMVDSVVQHIADKFAFDFEVVDGEVFEVVERGEA